MLPFPLSVSDMNLEKELPWQQVIAGGSGPKRAIRAFYWGIKLCFVSKEGKKGRVENNPKQLKTAFQCHLLSVCANQTLFVTLAFYLFIQ